jgi:protoporphyrinogen oxidase
MYSKPLLKDLLPEIAHSWTTTGANSTFYNGKLSKIPKDISGHGPGS